jgi:hypothetical protein
MSEIPTCSDDQPGERAARLRARLQRIDAQLALLAAELGVGPEQGPADAPSPPAAASGAPDAVGKAS